MHVFNSVRHLRSAGRLQPEFGRAVKAHFFTHNMRPDTSTTSHEWFDAEYHAMSIIPCLVIRYSGCGLRLVLLINSHSTLQAFSLSSSAIDVHGHQRRSGRATRGSGSGELGSTQLFARCGGIQFGRCRLITACTFVSVAPPSY